MEAIASRLEAIATSGKKLVVTEKEKKSLTSKSETSNKKLLGTKGISVGTRNY